VSVETSVPIYYLTYRNVLEFLHLHQVALRKQLPIRILFYAVCITYRTFECNSLISFRQAIEAR